MRSSSFQPLALALALLVMLFSYGSASTATATAGTYAGPDFGTDQVLIETGPIVGLTNEYGRTFRGIPYAMPPVGKEGRWKPARPAKPWGSVPYFARDYRAACPQICEDGVTLPLHTCPFQISEDCLFLNVYTPPVDQTNSTLPVMVYFHGGNFLTGAANTLYDGMFLAEAAHAIVVTVQYRLGVMGFLVADALDGGAVNNIGIEDQRDALRWVQRNIAAFGGDPNNVTLFGQSAGGRSVSVHMTSSGSAGLFHRAIIHSDPSSIICTTHEQALAFGERFAKAVGCDVTDTACFYALDMEEALAGQVAAMKHLPLDYPLSAFMPLLPTVDGVDLPDQPYNVVMAGRHHPVPVIMGTTADEVKLYIHMAWPNPVSAAEYRAAMRVLFKGNATEVLAEYPPVSGDNRSVMSVVGTHYVFSCPQRKFSRGLAAAGLAGPNSVFHYIHDQAWSFPGWEPNFSFCNGASCHGVDLPYYFNTATLMFDVTAPEQQLFRHIAGYFGNFVHTGNPNNGGGRGGSSPSSPATAWPGHSQTSDRYVVFTAPTPYSLSGYLQHECDFFDGIGYDPERVSRVANYLLSGIRA